MKAKILFAALLLHFNVMIGQWSSNGSAIYYDAGNVGIGTVNPDFPLNIERSGAFSSSFQIHMQTL